MNGANGAKVKHILGSLFFENQGNVGGVDPMKVGDMEILKIVNHLHDLQLYNFPTCFVESLGDISLLDSNP
jgi:hypothetical protein